MRLFRHLPAVDQLKRDPRWQGVPATDAVRTRVCRDVANDTRARIEAGALSDADAVGAHVERALAVAIERLSGPALRGVLNGLGVLVHTNAGRAPLSAEAIARVAETSRGYCNLELSLDTGARGSRQDLVRAPLRWLFDAEDALVVNNGAGALMLCLHALAAGRSAVVSRGELVEIGGSFRVPDVMRAAGVTLREVGTTNRTWPRDYQAALGEDAGAAIVLQVHRSNFRLDGFVHTPTVAELAAIAREAGVPLLVDLGSGVVDDLRTWGLDPEPTVRETLAAGADLVTFSGDKLLGGPQAGLILGRRALVAQIGRNAMARALRVDSMVLAALEATLRSHLAGRASAELPLWQAIDLPVAALREEARALVAELRAALGPEGEPWRLRLGDGEAAIGGGAQPGATLPSVELCVRHRALDAPALARALRAASPPLLGRPRGADVHLDLRSLRAGAGDALAERLSAALQSAPTG